MLNLKMKYISSMYENPVKKMLKKGLCVTVNSDDPAIFGGYLNLMLHLQQLF